MGERGRDGRNGAANLRRGTGRGVPRRKEARFAGAGGGATRAERTQPGGVRTRTPLATRRTKRSAGRWARGHEGANMRTASRGLSQAGEARRGRAGSRSNRGVFVHEHPSRRPWASKEGLPRRRVRGRRGRGARRFRAVTRRRAPYRGLAGAPRTGIAQGREALAQRGARRSPTTSSSNTPSGCTARHAIAAATPAWSASAPSARGPRMSTSTNTCASALTTPGRPGEAA